MKQLTRLLIACALLSGGAIAQQPVSPEALLKAAMQREQVDGDAAGALSDYKVIGELHPRSPVAARALARMAAIYDRQGELELARASYQRIVTEHAQSPEAAAARTALKKLTAPAAAVAPPQTFSLESLFRGFNTRPDVSPDGLLVAGGRLVGSPARLRAALDVRAVASGAQRTLVEGLEGAVRTVRFSPDGSRLAAYVVQFAPGADATRPESPSRVSLVVASAHVKTGSPINLPIWEGPRSDEFQVVESLPWSPNGQWLPYPSNLSGKSEAFLLDARSGKARPLGVALDGAPDFLWSPDGRQLAVRVGNGAIQIVTIGTGVSRTVAVPSAATATTRLGAWPSAGAIAITQLPEGAHPGTTTEVSLLSVADGSLVPICKGFPILSGSDAGLATFGSTVDLCFGFSRDGRTELIWRHENRRLMQRDVAAGTERPLVSGFAEERGASISRDSRVVVFFSNRDARWGLYAARLDASAPTTPVRIAALDDLPTVARVLWSDTAVLAQLTQSDAHVFRVQMDPATGRSAGELLQLTQESTNNITPTLSNDGKQIAFFSRRGGLTYPTVMNADGSGPERTLPPSVLNTRTPMPWLSAKQVLIADAGKAAILRLEFSLLDSATGVRTPTRLSPPSYPGERGSWAVDSAREEVIVATGPEKGTGPIEFRARSIPTTTDRLLATIESPAAPLDYFAVSKDGTQIAYFLSTYFSNVDPCAPCELGVINLTTGLRRQLPNPKAPTIPVAWSPDGRFLLYGAGRPRVMNVETGESWTLMAPAQQPAWTQSGSWAPDGSFLVLSATTQRGEWKLWKDVTVDGLAKAGRR